MIMMMMIVMMITGFFFVEEIIVEDLINEEQSNDKEVYHGKNVPSDFIFNPINVLAFEGGRNHQLNLPER